MTPLRFKVTYLIITVMLGCTNSQQDRDISLIYASLESSNSVLNKNLSHTLNLYRETWCSDPHFLSLYKRGLIVDSICNKFYNTADRFLKLERISKPEIEMLRINYHNTLDSIKALNNHNKGYRKDNLIPIDKDYNMSSNISNYRVLGIIFKNDVIQNEINTLESIYALYEGCSWPPKKVICEVDEVKNGKYSFKVIVVEETVLNVTRRIEMDSIFFNGKKTQMDLNKLSKTSEVVSFNSLKNGNYALYGKLIVDNACSENSMVFPFSHKFTQD